MLKNIFLALPFMALISCGTGESKKVEKTDVSPKTEMATSHDAWSKNATIYEANIRQYSPEGTFDAFTADLARIKDMGITIIWLMPIHPIGEVNRKGGKGSYYSVKDYKGVNPEFGTEEDFRELVEKAHSLGMKVIIDWVANHSAFDNVWTEAHKDWYNLDSLGNLQPPAGTDWWDVADLNFENAEMRAEMISSMQYWLEEFNIDGYRCDVASMVPVEFWNDCRDSLELVRPDVFMLAEAESPELQEKAFDMGYAWEFMHIINHIAKGEMSLNDLDNYLAKEDTNFAKKDYRMYFTTNHDENSWNGTVMERYGEEGHKTYAVLAYTVAGMPLLYSGQEAGMDYALKFFEKDTIEWGDYQLQDFYTKLLQLNKDQPALWNGIHRGSFQRLETGADEEVYAYVRAKDESKVVVVCNFSDAPAQVKIDGLPAGNFEALFESPEVSSFSNGKELKPFEYHVYYTK